MEFLNEAVIKAKDVFDVARRKTGEVVTAEKKKFEISLLRSKREKDLAGLGRIYYEKLKSAESMDDNERELVSAIKEKNKKIALLIEEIKNAKNVKACNLCGEEIPEEAEVCPKCGEKCE